MATPAVWGIIFLLFASCAVTKTQLINELWQKCKTWFGCPTSLDMAPNSVDDMYNGCEKDMESLIPKYLPNEKNNMLFKSAWDAAEKYYNSKWKTNSPLNKNQIMALHAYTLNEPPLYREFNKAVREQKAHYKTRFPYHTLHFYLTMALRSLKVKGCVTGYRRASCKFSTNVQNKEIRFSAFTSSSIGGYCSQAFGAESCFEINTCFGVEISKFSKFPGEREILIPPYEVFKVTEIKRSSTKNPLPCKVVYKLESTKRTHSNLNCALSSQDLMGY